MKRSAIMLPLLLVLLNGCFYYQHQTLPEEYYTAADMERQGLERGEYFIKTSYGFRLFTIPCNMPQGNRMIDQAIREAEAQGVTDLEVEFNEVNLLLFQIPKLCVRGYTVKKK